MLPLGCFLPFPCPFIQRSRYRKKDEYGLISDSHPTANVIVASSASSTRTNRTQLHVNLDPLITEVYPTKTYGLMHVLPYLHAAKKSLRQNNKRAGRGLLPPGRSSCCCLRYVVCGRDGSLPCLTACMVAAKKLTTTSSSSRSRRHGYHISTCRSSRSGPSFPAGGPGPEIRTARLLGPVRSGPPAAGPNGGSVRDRTGPDRVHPDMSLPRTHLLVVSSIATAT